MSFLHNIQGVITQQLLRIETLGNRLPHPSFLFIFLCGLTALLSTLCALLGLSVNHPATNEEILVRNILSTEGSHYILSSAVTNFTNFAPVGTVLVAMMGIGVAEHSGLLKAVLNATILKAPTRFMTFLIVMAGVLSSLAADTGYVVLIPLAGMAFAAANRNPVVGITAAFAGVSGGYSANLLIGPLDAILAGLSTEAAALLDPGYNVSAAGNYYFTFISTFLIAIVGTLVTEKWTEPMLQTEAPRTIVPQLSTLSVAEYKGIKYVLIFSLLFITLLGIALIPENAMLRNPEDGSILSSPFITGIVFIISVYASLAGYIYGKVSGSFTNNRELIIGMEKSMATMASYLVLMFFAAQFTNWFNWSQLGIIIAIYGAELLRAINPNTIVLAISFVILISLINLLIGSASAKWALLAPVFVPMLFLAGLSPEATQVAYRIGDSSTNIITPLMPYFGVVVAFIQKYDRNAGIGTLIATMLPYSLTFLLCWSIMLALWIMLGIPLGPGAYVNVDIL